VLFWTLAILAGWRATQGRATTKDWFWVGLWMGFGFLSKYTALFQLLCWAVFFVLWPPARKHLRRAGPYVALLVGVICALPVLVWNWQNGWISVTHVTVDAGVGEPWEPTLKYAGEFLGSEAALLNPVFFIAMIWAAIAFWRRGRHDPKLIFLFSMGAPLFLSYLAHTLRSRGRANWIAPSVLPLFCLMVGYWEKRWRLEPGQDGRAFLRNLFLALGLVLGFAAVFVGHNTDVARKLIGHYLPVEFDPLHHVRKWDTTAWVVNEARRELLSDGQPVFIIADDYGLAGEISFYLPEARQSVRDTPLVYCRSGEVPENQFYFGPRYEEQRHGQNAIYVRELNRQEPTPCPVPARLQAEFESVGDLGVTNVMYHGYLLRPLQRFACRKLK